MMDSFCTYFNILGVLLANQLFMCNSSSETNDYTRTTIIDKLKQLHHTLTGTQSSSDTNGFIYESYQRGMQCNAAFSPVIPTTLQDLQDIVRYARKKKLKVKAIGSLHSITDIICTDGIVVNMTNIQHFSFDPVTNRAKVGAGMQLLDFLNNLHVHGRGLTSSPAYGGITIGGAIGTGAHGSSLKGPASVSDQVFSMTVVDGTGNVRQINNEDEDFKAFQVNLGLLGIIYEVEVNTVEQYKIEINSFPVKDDILWRNDSKDILEVIENADMFEFWWYPTSKQVVFTKGTMVARNTSGNCQSKFIRELNAFQCKGISTAAEVMQAASDDISIFFMQTVSKFTLYKEIPGMVPVFTKKDGITSCLPTSVGYSHEILAHRCQECFWKHGNSSVREEDQSIAIALSELPAAIKSLREIFDKYITPFPFAGIFLRILRSSDAYLELNSNRNSVAIEWITLVRWDSNEPKLGIAAYQAMGQALIQRHGGRPHWGKNGAYYSNPEILRRAHPQLDKFVEVMTRMDPDEIFMNSMGQRIKYGRNVFTVLPQKKNRCALNEVCLCKNNLDCGNGGVLDYECTKFMEFSVCQKPPILLNVLRDGVSRNVINLAADAGVTLEDCQIALANFNLGL